MVGLRLTIAAGGTGGHILPAIRIAEAITQEAQVEFICGSKDIEKTVYEGEGRHAFVLRAGRAEGRRKLLDVTLDTITMLRRFTKQRPDAVLAMGGAACFPVLAAAVVMRVPIFLHESNRIPGRVIRLYARFAKKVFLGLGGYDGANAVMTGTPAKQMKAQPAARDLILCYGGSQGSAKLNELFVEVANSAEFENLNLGFLLLSGPGKVIAHPGRVEVRPYESDMAGVLRRTAVAITRAGAGSLADLAAFEIPAILVPYPFAMDDHQTVNALSYVDGNAATLIRESELTAESLTSTLRRLMDDARLRREMAANLRPFHRPDAAATIVSEIIGSIRSTARHPLPEASHAR